MWQRKEQCFYAPTEGESKEEKSVPLEGTAFYAEFLPKEDKKTKYHKLSL